MKFRLYYLIIILAPLLQFVFANSNTTELVNWELINITGIFLIVANKKLTAMLMIIVLNSMVELLTGFPLVGITSFSFFSAYLIWELLIKYLVFLGRDRKFVNLFLAFITAIIFDHVIRLIAGYESTLFELRSLILNIGSFLIFVFLYNKFRGPQNAFKS